MTNVWPLQCDCDSFYGNPRGANDEIDPRWEADNLILISCPWSLHMGDIQIPHIRVHKLCSDSMLRALNSTWDALGHDVSKIKAARFDEFDGAFNWRNKRGGSSLSMHAYGAAADWDAADNSFHSLKHLFTKDTVLIAKFMAENWVWGGGWSPGSIDAMHVQAARVH